MQKFLSRIRFWFEIVALPAFAFLVMHLAGHGVSTLFENGAPAHKHASELLAHFFSVETGIGILLLILFVWIWHRPALKKWIPCSHEHCHHQVGIPHVLAIVALCVHFFPEAGVRHSLLQNLQEGGLVNIVGAIGFVAHFFVDVIGAILLAIHFPKLETKIFVFSVIAVAWLTAFFIGKNFIEHLPAMAEGILFLASAFVLAMFVHAPHRPIRKCHTCDH